MPFQPRMLPCTPGLFFPLLSSAEGVSALQSALVLFATELVFGLCCRLFVLPACTPKLLLGLFPLRGTSAPKLKPAGFGGSYIFWLWHSPDQGPAVGRDSSWEVWGTPPPPPQFSPFQLFELSSSCSEAAPAPGKTLCVPSCTFLHLPQTLLCWAAPALGKTEESARSELH